MASLRTDELLVLSLSFLIICFRSTYCDSAPDSESNNTIFTIDSLRDSLEKQEDFIVFCLIERARYPYNSPAYNNDYYSSSGGSWVNVPSPAEHFVRETESIQAKFGRYQNPEELPFFPDHHTQPVQAAPPFKFPQFLDPAASSVNVSRAIWNIYFGHLLQLITRNGDDGNYQQAAASDLVCLQALSKRIHYGRFVAEVKFRDSPSSYIPAIHAKGTRAYGILFKHEENSRLFGFTDSDWGGDLEDRKSTGGFIFFLGSSPVSWSSRKQQTVALSTAEAEFMALNSAACEGIWLQKLKRELIKNDQKDDEEEKGVKILCDNTSAIALAKNPVFHARSKHIDIRFHFIREAVEKKAIHLEFCPSQDQLADILTKPLPRKRFLELRTKIGMRDGADLGGV